MFTKERKWGSEKYSREEITQNEGGFIEFWFWIKMQKFNENEQEKKWLPRRSIFWWRSGNRKEKGKNKVTVETLPELSKGAREQLPSAAEVLAEGIQSMNIEVWQSGWNGSFNTENITDM